MIRVFLPFHLRTLAQVQGEVMIEVEGRATQRSLLDALEAKYPVLAGTIRDRQTQRRRPFLRFFACQRDYSNAEPDEELPPPVVLGEEPFLIIGGLAGG